MKKSYSEGLAIHTGPESCGGAREGAFEALTGVRAGRVLSRERSLRGAEAVRRSRRPHCSYRHREIRTNPARSETPSMHGNTSRENRDIRGVPEKLSGRVGKSKDARR
jgi:RNA-directed DNA polymerase